MVGAGGGSTEPRNLGHDLLVVYWLSLLKSPVSDRLLQLQREFS